MIKRYVEIPYLQIHTLSNDRSMAPIYNSKNDKCLRLFQIHSEPFTINFSSVWIKAKSCFLQQKFLDVLSIRFSYAILLGNT